MQLDSRKTISRANLLNSIWLGVYKYSNAVQSVRKINGNSQSEPRIDVSRALVVEIQSNGIRTRGRSDVCICQRPNSTNLDTKHFFYSTVVLTRYFGLPGKGF